MEYMKIHNYTYNIFNTHKSLSIMSILKTHGMHMHIPRDLVLKTFTKRNYYDQKTNSIETP